MAEVDDVRNEVNDLITTVEDKIKQLGLPDDANPAAAGLQPFYKEGVVRVLADGDPLPTSSLAGAFMRTGQNPTETIVLRGYLGRSDVFAGAVSDLKRAATIWRDDLGNLKKIKAVLTGLNELWDDAKGEIPLRLYLTPSLDRYVDFHRSSLISVRREPRAERQDTFTVWLRMLQGDGRPIPYKVIQETNIVPTFGGYLGGDLIDDYLGGSGSASGAWGDQALFGGGRPATGIYCGNKNTGIKCLD